MGNVEYGSKLYSDLKSSLPDDVFKKKYGHLKAAPRPVTKTAPKKNGLGGDKIGEAMAEHKSRANMFGANPSGMVDLKAVAKKLIKS